VNPRENFAGKDASSFPLSHLQLQGLNLKSNQEQQCSVSSAWQAKKLWNKFKKN